MQILFFLIDLFFFIDQYWQISRERYDPMLGYRFGISEEG